MINAKAVKLASAQKGSGEKERKKNERVCEGEGERKKKN
jgi:hypothetical protein